MIRVEKYVQVSNPEFEAVKVDTVRDNRRITHHHHDELIASLIAMATEEVEATTGRLLAARNMEGYVRLIPADGIIEITRGPVISVTKIEYYPSGSDVLTTMPSSNYVLYPDLDSLIAIDEVPSVNYNKLYPMIITYVGGYADEASVNRRLHGAVVLKASEYHANPDNAGQNFGTSQRLTAADLLMRPLIVKNF